MSQGELEALSKATEKAAIDLEVSIMKDIVRRIKANLDIENSLTASADYQIRVLRQMGYSDEYIKAQIQTFLKTSEEEIDRIYNQVSENHYKAYEDAYDSLGRKQTPFGSHPIINQTIRAAVEQSKNTFKNLTNTMGFTRNVGGKRVFLPVASYYQRVLDEATLGVTTGAFDYATMLTKVVKEMTKSGLRTVEYASGRTYRIESAARMALMTGFRQIVAKVNEQTAKELDTDTYEISYHIGARPDHQVWQGRVYTHKELIDICGLGTAGGLCGVNCYHWYEPYIEGVSVRNYTDAELDRMVAEENKKTEFEEKEYTTYEALQRQRKLELTMRKYRQDIMLLKEGGNEGIELLGAQARYKQTMDEYVRFSKAMKLPQQRERVYMDGLGRVTTKARKASKGILGKMKISIPQDVVENARLSKNVENKINQAIKKLEKEYTIYLDRIEGGKLERRDIFVIGAYLDETGILKHNLVLNYNVDYNEVEKRMKALYATGYMAGKSYEDYIAHEMAHIIPFQNCVTESDYRKLTATIKREFVEGVSKYADKTHDGRESLAEAFVRYRNGERIPDESRKLIEKYIIPWRRK